MNPARLLWIIPSQHTHEAPNHGIPWRYNLRSSIVLLFLVMALWQVPALTAAESYQKYLWQTYRVRQIDAQAAADLLGQLQREVEKILDRPPLAPLRLSYGDEPEIAYWLYYERGRIITTLSYAYPHVSRKQQEGIRSYVRKLLADPKHAPYIEGILGPTDGASRALHGRLISQGRYIHEYGHCPTLHVLYGLWLYGDRSGDWQALKPYWTQIKTRYLRGLEEEPRLYGQMSAHIALARLAKRFQDAELLGRAETALTDDLQEGKDLARIVKRLERTRFAYFYDSRRRPFFPGDCWIFLEACPEILRYLQDTQKQEVLRRTQLLEAKYPLWWLHQAPYFTRWTGDESVGVVPELIGMIFPVQRWIAQKEPAELARFMRSTPVGIGDCYWLEALVHTIEAFGHLEWKKVE